MITTDYSVNSLGLQSKTNRCGPGDFGPASPPIRGSAPILPSSKTEWTILVCSSTTTRVERHGFSSLLSTIVICTYGGVIFFPGFTICKPASLICLFRRGTPSSISLFTSAINSRNFFV